MKIKKKVGGGGGDIGKKERGEGDASWGTRGGKLHIPQLPELRHAFVFFEDLIIHPAAERHSSTHADKGKSLYSHKRITLLTTG